MPAWLKAILPKLREGPAREPAPWSATLSASDPLKILSEHHDAYSAPGLVVGHLRISKGSLGVDHIILLTDRPLHIGRDESNDLQFFDDRISRFHARVEFDRIFAMHLILDLGSTNGVFVNGQRIAAKPTRTALHEGDRLDIGGTGEVVLTYEQLRGLARGAGDQLSVTTTNFLESIPAHGRIASGYAEAVAEFLKSHPG